MQLSNREIKNRIKKMVDGKSFVFDREAERWFSYADIWDNAAAIADSPVFKDHDKVIAVLDNGIHLFLLYFASMLANTMIIPLDPRKSEEERLGIIQEHAGAPVIENEKEYEISSNRMEPRSMIAAIEAIDLDKPYMITYTSGSTGHAKGVIHSLRNLFLASDAFGTATGLDERYTMCHVMPMTYMAGILNTIIMPFFMGCRIVLLPKFDIISAVSFWREVKDHSISAFWLTPTMLNILMTVDKKGKGKGCVHTDRPLFFVGTAPLYETIRNKFENKYGVKLFQSYGLSETLFVSTEKAAAENDPRSAGFVLDDAGVIIYDDHEIGVQVPWMFCGYSNNHTKDYFKDGCYLTGDLGRIEGKKLYITGRKKDLIIKGGMNISPSMIEACINDTELVKECAVSGIVINDEEHIVCWYVPKENLQLIESELNELIGKTIGKHCRIDRYHAVREIPRNLNGKVDKQKLREGYHE